MCFRADPPSVWDLDLTMVPESPDLFDVLLAKTAAACDLDVEDVKGGLSRRCFRARRIVMVLLRRMRGDSMPQIGEQFGGRDHTTVLHALQTFDALPVESWERRTASNIEAAIRHLEATGRIAWTRHASARNQYSTRETRHAA